jgi:hypothetical protein
MTKVSGGIVLWAAGSLYVLTHLLNPYSDSANKASVRCRYCLSTVKDRIAKSSSKFSNKRTA